MSHVDRMKQERQDLSEKIIALDKFIFSNEIFKSLSDIERASMCKQLAHMEGYMLELSERIRRAKQD